MVGGVLEEGIRKPLVEKVLGMFPGAQPIVPKVRALNISSCGRHKAAISRFFRQKSYVLQDLWCKFHGGFRWRCIGLEPVRTTVDSRICVMDDYSLTVVETCLQVADINLLCLQLDPDYGAAMLAWSRYFDRLSKNVSK